MQTTAERSGRARVAGTPGGGARAAGLIRLVTPLLAVMLAAGYLLRAAWPYPELPPAATGLLFILLAGGGAFLMLGMKRGVAAFIKGALGEERVARELAFLPAPYQVFNGLPPRHRAGVASARRDCDHVVVGPSGVFVVETKNWSGRIAVQSGRILCDGREPGRSPLEQVRGAASGLAARLREAGAEAVVHPVLCFAGEPLDEPVAGVGGVMVCGVETLNRVIKEGVESPVGAVTQETVGRLLRQWMGPPA